METRTITQVRIYVLVLNTIFGRVEDGTIAAISDDYQKLVDFYNSQLLDEGYRDSLGYYHSFKEGPLNQLNPCPRLELNKVDWCGYGIHDEWINEDVWYNIENKYLLV